MRFIGGLKQKQVTTKAPRREDFNFSLCLGALVAG
jgi:hypothetical protein